MADCSESGPEARRQNASDRARLTRREFVERAALLAAVAAASSGGCRVAEAPAGSGEPATPTPATAGAEDAFELREAGIATLQAGLTAGRWTSRGLVGLYLERIRELDEKGPGLRSIIEVNPDAHAIADALDAERKARGPRGPLHGVPILIKDNIDTGDRMKTTAGSLALANSVASRDALLVQRLRQAGAVILAKTNLSEWANFRSTKSTSGWSARGGQCRNPYVLDRNPCGSSSGSGAAVASSFAAAAVGTETDGSIICPSNSCGLVGIKPTVGLISRSGIIPISSTQDTAGPMARNVTDAVALLSAMTGIDARDPATEASRGQVPSDFAQFLDPKGLDGTRLGIARKFFGFNPAVDTILDAAIDVLRKQGATIIDPADLATHGQFDTPEFTVLLHEFKAGINDYLGSLGSAVGVKSLKDLIAFNEREKEKEMPFFGQDIFIKAEATSGLDAEPYRKARQTCRSLARDKGIDALMGARRLDAIVAPAGGPAWTIDPLNGDHFVGGSSTPAAVAGYPSITVPAGFIHTLPVGIAFFGRRWSEPTLIKIAFAYEQATHHRRPPKFLSTLQDSA
jgi:amidase